MKQPIPADQALSHDVGSHTIHLQRTHDGGFTLWVSAGPTVIDELSDQFADETLARHAARSIAQRLNAGEPIHTLIADRRNADRELINSINATMNAATTRYLAPRNAARKAGFDALVQSAPNQRRTRRTWSALMQAALDSRNAAGEIHVGMGVAARTLEAMARQGYGRLVTGGEGRRRFEVVKLVLNQAGIRAAEQQVAA